ncbi:MAG TPA: hypothetical protein VH878_06950 [Thermodesulfobacteriota bacterium]|jgi:hypothetical protein
MSDLIKDRVRDTVLRSRLHRDFLELTNELLKNQTSEAIEFANKIITEEVEELTQEISILMQE